MATTATCTVVTGNGDINNRSTNNITFRARGYITADARNQTEYGTVRSYIAVGISTSDIGLETAANQFSANRAFIQWAGFTFGIAQSFFDFYSGPATSYWGNYPASDTGDGAGRCGYTAQFGNGFSATIAAEKRRTTQIINITSTSGTAAGVVASAIAAGSNGSIQSANAGFAAGGYGGFNAPDVVANLRVDQAWGSAQIMGAVHEVNAAYYGLPQILNGTGAPEFNGNPSDKGLGGRRRLQVEYTVAP